jgi:hypothetical protein
VEAEVRRARKRQPERQMTKITTPTGVSILRNRHSTAIASNLSKDLLEVVLIPSSPEALVFRADRQALFLLQ